MQDITALIVPTLNAGDQWGRWISAFETQTFKPKHVLVIDSSSDDETPDLAQRSGLTVRTISRDSFNHGGTRQSAVDLMPGAAILIFATQDAIFEDRNAIRILVEAFMDPQVGAAYGRQLPHEGAGLIGAHARLFNYGEKSQVRSLGDAGKLGMKTAFISNSFAAYRRAALAEAGGFPNNIILGEDSYIAAKMLLSGWKIAYCAEARVFHSHDYSMIQEFKRYFDMGVFHAREPWLRTHFGNAEGEGFRYIKSEFKYLLERKPVLVPSALFRNGLKYLGYKLGLFERRIALRLKGKLSMHPRFWAKP